MFDLNAKKKQFVSSFKPMILKWNRAQSKFVHSQTHLHKQNRVFTEYIK